MLVTLKISWRYFTTKSFENNLSWRQQNNGDNFSLKDVQTFNITLNFVRCKRNFYHELKSEVSSFIFEI